MAHGVTFPVSIDVVESMGSDVFAYFTLEGGPAESAELEELARATRAGPTSAPTATRSWPGSTPTTKIPESEDAELWVDTRSIHVFDPSTGENLTQAIDLRSRRRTAGHGHRHAESGCCSGQ